jgi:hypothetical protein
VIFIFKKIKEDKMTDTLPDKPSELILLALEDLEKTEKDYRYKIDMDVYHDRLVGNGMICSVCLAGAVMAQRLSPDNTDRCLMPGYFNTKIRDKLYALNSFRQGEIYSGLYEMNKSFSRDDVDQIDAFVTPYELDPGEFKSDMRRLAQELSDIGL